ncbi:DUF4276 family protein [Phormidium yuhuli AB48]|uniref:DUF4276 family protein n=1 Tax=Phormidium yuhuli AB48 TaxID=2940671 RepID=A0ABY5ARM1_9CYAN|nr:DUF4276 family protein [Phormidium yuhuli]USR91864.1 DUF4276 family protein [Phormidium yuhuli AB48]
MHFEILVEDISGKTALDIIIPKIIDISDKNTFKINFYKGIGRIPKGLKPSSDPSKRILLDQLPKLIQGFGKTFSNYPANYHAVLIVICDLDDRCLSEFRRELFDCLEKCMIPPSTYFCIAIEEGEAWFLGDTNAIKKAYPNAKDVVLNEYSSDEICGTWEKLADALFPGGSKQLTKQGWQAIGKQKTEWAKTISPYMNVDANQSPSFCYFRDKLRYLATS